MADAIRCQWHEEPDGTRYLIPGCMTRVNDPDADPCDCLMLEDELAKVRAELAKEKRHHEGLRHWHDQIVKAVYAHPDGIKIMAASTKEPTHAQAS